MKLLEQNSPIQQGMMGLSITLLVNPSAVLILQVAQAVLSFIMAAENYFGSTTVAMDVSHDQCYSHRRLYHFSLCLFGWIQLYLMVVFVVIGEEFVNDSFY